MKPPTLRDKLLELHSSCDENGEVKIFEDKDLFRCVTNYLHRKYDSKKIQRLVDDMYSRYDLNEESINLMRRKQLLDYIDSIITSKIRDSYKTSKPLDINSLDKFKFKALIRQVVLYFGYEILHIPLNNKYIDLIIHRGDIKIAVLSVKNNSENFIGVKTVRQFRYMANYYHCEQALLFTNTFFSPEASHEAAEIRVSLFDKEKLTPIVANLVDGFRQEEKEYILNEMEERKNTIYLEGEVKFPKTKVQVVFIKYFMEEETNRLIFEGKLINTGKRPASDLSVEIKLFNRNDDWVYLTNSPAKKQILESKEETTFKCYFDNIPQHDWKDLCRYQLKLDYKNTYKR